MDDPRARSPWHAGERALQARIGMAAKMEALGQRVIRDHMPEQHRTFFAQLPFVVVGAVDAAGAPWATVLEGFPGFVQSPDPRRLRIDALPADDDPAGPGLATGAAVGVLGIELPTRRRNRMNGPITRRDARGFDVAVRESFGNCPQYIHTRDLGFARAPGTGGGNAEHAAALDADARALIARAETFFVASYVDVDGDPARRQVDVSHRGGNAGFVRVDGDVLTIPDFSGNRFFNTLGNLAANPRAGLVFVDLARGDLVQLTGRTALIFDGEELARFAGAERLWRVTVERVVRRRDALALRGGGGAPSPQALATGAW